MVGLYFPLLEMLMRWVLSHGLKMVHGLYSASNSFLEGNPIRRMGILANKEATRSFPGMATIPMQWIALRLE